MKRLRSIINFLSIRHPSMYSVGWRQKKSISSGFKICLLAGHLNMSFGRESKYIIWWGVEICHFVGHWNMSFGQRGDMLFAQAKKWSKYFIWMGSKLCHLVGYWKLSIGWSSNYFIWSMSLGQALEYLKYSFIRRNHIIFFCTDSY